MAAPREDWMTLDSVELVGLLNVAHHHFGSSWIGHPGAASGSFNLVDDPVQVPTVPSPTRVP
jgi:hypothetical protein